MGYTLYPVGKDAYTRITMWDADLLEGDAWHVSDSGYARRDSRRGKREALLHRIIAERAYGPIPQGMIVDHINRDRLDNRRENLRIADAKVNANNRKERVKGYKHPHAGNYFGGRPCWTPPNRWAK